MIKVIEKISDQRIYDEVKEYIEKVKLKELDAADFSVPDQFRLVTKKWVAIMAWATFFLLFIPTILYIRKRKKLNVYLNEKIDINITLKDYNDFFNQYTYFDFLEIHETQDRIPELARERNLAVNSFPMGSIIDYEYWSNVSRVGFYNHYSLENQAVSIKYHYYRTETYTDSKGNIRTRTVRYDRRWDKSISIGAIDFFRKDSKNFFIAANTRVSGGHKLKHKLENSKFNHKFNIVTNDKLKANLIFTPLTQEVLVKSSGPKSFIIKNNIIEMWDSWNANIFKFTNDIIFKNSDFKKGKKYLAEVIIHYLADPIIELNNNYSTIMQLPIWKYKGKRK